MKNSILNKSTPLLKVKSLVTLTYAIYLQKLMIENKKTKSKIYCCLMVSLVLDFLNEDTENANSLAQ